MEVELSSFDCHFAGICLIATGMMPCRQSFERAFWTASLQVAKYMLGLLKFIEVLAPDFVRHLTALGGFSIAACQHLEVGIHKRERIPFPISCESMLVKVIFANESSDKPCLFAERCNVAQICICSSQLQL